MSDGIIQGIGAMAFSGSLPNLDKDLGTLADVGFDHAELSVTDCAVVVGGALHPVRTRQVVEIVRRHGLGATVHAPLILNLMDPAHAALHMAVARASIDFCRELDARVLVVHPGWVDPLELKADRDRLLDMERRAYAELAEYAAGAGVVLCLENMPVILESLTGTLDNHGCDPDSIADQIAAVDHPNLRATIDVSHAHLAASHHGRDLADSLARMAPLTRHLHIHDSFGRAPTIARAGYKELLAYGMGDIHLPVGWGNIDFETVLAALDLPAGLSMTLEINGVYACREVWADSLLRARKFMAALNDAPRADAAQ